MGLTERTGRSECLSLEAQIVNIQVLQFQPNFEPVPLHTRYGHHSLSSWCILLPTIPTFLPPLTSSSGAAMGN